MTLAIVYSRATSGTCAPLVTVEVHLSRGMPRLNIVGLPATAVKESKDRVRSALLNTHFEFPRRRLTINLAPADLPKEGGRFDLPIALGILAASGQIPSEKLSHYEFVGELALSGELRPVRGVLPIVLAAREAGHCLIVPSANADEAGLVKQANVFSANHLLDVCGYLTESIHLQQCTHHSDRGTLQSQLDLLDVHGQSHAKRALEIAAAGKHSLLLIGQPGTGKTMLATRLPTILPDLTDQQALEAAAIFSVSRNGFAPEQWQQLPFRSPHHSSSVAALVGGGRPPRPGEISLAHHGVLFLDELPEFNRHVLESLREPLESGQVTISRAAYQETFPARFQLIAAMNPCPCGFFGSEKGNCNCTSEQIQRYISKLSGPLLDRIDMQVIVSAVTADMLTKAVDPGERSLLVKERVQRVHELQLARQLKFNQDLLVNELPHFCYLTNESQGLLAQAMQKYNFTARTYHRILKVARTIADLAGCSEITVAHLSESMAYRCLDKTLTR